MNSLSYSLGWLITTLALATPAIAASPLSSAPDIRGLWVDSRERDKQAVAVWIDECDGRLCGHIYWLKKPLSAVAPPKRDRPNPNVLLRARPRCGLRIMSGFRRLTENTWGEGEIYNPGSGQTYQGNLSLGSDGTLGVRGFVGISVFGKTIEWVRPSEMPERCK